MVRPKKFLGQHFLKDQNIAAKIVDALVLLSSKNFVLEIGPGTGVLTKLLREKPEVDLHLAEIDRESVAYLKEHYPDLSDIFQSFRAAKPGDASSLYASKRSSRSHC